MLEDGKPYWRRNLAVMWISQFLSLMGFSMSIPFAPFYLRLLGADTEGEVRAYAALSAALSQISFAVMAPVWGVLADRFGRKPMVLRANFGGAVIVGLMALVPNVGWFVFLRAMQGFFTGTMSACMTMVVTCAPRQRQGYALGVLSSSVFSGDMAGLFIGGVLANTFGYRPSFVLAGCVLGLSGMLVALTAREDFVPVRKERMRGWPSPFSPGSTRSWVNVLLPVYPLFVLYVFSTLARYLDNSQIALYVEQLNGGQGYARAASLASWVLCFGSIGAMLSGLVLASRVDRHGLQVLRFASFGAALFMLLMVVLPPLLSGQERVMLGQISTTWAVLAMMPLRFCMVFASAGFEPVFNSWLSNCTPTEHKGLMFGYAAMFRSLGAVGAHALAGFLAYYCGVWSIYVCGPLMFLLLVPLIRHYYRRIARRMEEIAPHPQAVAVKAAVRPAAG